MSETIINSAEDMQWLRDTHLKELSPRFLSALIRGNEDSPDYIETYVRAEPSVHDVGVGFTQDVDGKFRLAFDRQAVADALITFASHNDTKGMRERILTKCNRTRDLSSIGLHPNHETQWEAIDSLDEAAREHYFELLRRELGEEGQEIVDNYLRIQDVAGVEIKVSSRDHDPFEVHFEISDVIADAWADAHGSLCGGTWETAGGTDFVYDIGMWHPGLWDELKKEGYNLDFSEWSDPDEDDLAIANHLGECPECEGKDFAAAKKHVTGEDD